MNRQLRRLTTGLLVLSIASTTQAEVIGHSAASKVLHAPALAPTPTAVE